MVFIAVVLGMHVGVEIGFDVIFDVTVDVIFDSVADYKQDILDFCNLIAEQDTVKSIYVDEAHDKFELGHYTGYG